MDGLLLTLRVIVSLAAVLGVLWYLQRKLSRGSARAKKNEAITVLGRQGLGQKAQIVVVQIDDTRYVLGVTEKNVSVIDTSAAVRPRPQAVELPREQAIETADAATGTDGTVTDFDRILAASGTVESLAPERVEPLRRPRNHNKSSPLAGSILSPATWRQTAEVIRQGR